MGGSSCCVGRPSEPGNPRSKLGIFDLSACGVALFRWQGVHLNGIDVDEVFPWVDNGQFIDALLLQGLRMSCQRSMSHGGGPELIDCWVINGDEQWCKVTAWWRLKPSHLANEPVVNRRKISQSLDEGTNEANHNGLTEDLWLAVIQFILCHFAARTFVYT